MVHTTAFELVAGHHLLGKPWDMIFADLSILCDRRPGGDRVALLVHMGEVRQYQEKENGNEKQIVCGTTGRRGAPGQRGVVSGLRVGHDHSQRHGQGCRLTAAVSKEVRQWIMEFAMAG